VVKNIGQSSRSHEEKFACDLESSGAVISVEVRASITGES